MDRVRSMPKARKIIRLGKSPPLPVPVSTAGLSRKMEIIFETGVHHSPRLCSRHLFSFCISTYLTSLAICDGRQSNFDFCLVTIEIKAQKEGRKYNLVGPIFK